MPGTEPRHATAEPGHATGKRSEIPRGPFRSASPSHGRSLHKLTYFYCPTQPSQKPSQKRVAEIAQLRANMSPEGNHPPIFYTTFRFSPKRSSAEWIITIRYPRLFTDP